MSEYSEPAMPKAALLAKIQAMAPRERLALAADLLLIEGKEGVAMEIARWVVDEYDARQCAGDDDLSGFDYTGGGR